MNWRIVVPVVVLLSVLGFVLYKVVKEPSTLDDIQNSLPVTMKRFGRALQKDRDLKDLEKYCARPAMGQCRGLLAEIAKQERGTPGSVFQRFRVKAESTTGADGTGGLDLIDGGGRVFLVVRCKLTRLPDKTWKITDVSWNPLIAP